MNMENGKGEQNNQYPLKRYAWIFFISSLFTALWVLIIRFLHKKSLEKKSAERERIQHVIQEGIQGLTESEAEALRIEGQDNAVSFEHQRTMKDILRDNVANIFNLSLLGVASIQFMLGMLWDGLLSLLIALLNIGIQVGQELFIRKRLEDVVRTTRPQATVIRDGQAWSIDPNEIVKGDALVVGPGDQFMADGEMLSEKPISVNESQLRGEGANIVKRCGDTVYAGSFCISGRGAYKAQIVGDERLISKIVSDAPLPKKVLTPLELIVKKVLSVMLVIVVALFSILLTRYFNLDKTVGVDLDAIVSATSVIFSLAPASLYFMIFLNYVTGTTQLAKQGALAHRARSVETLAHATDICVTQGSTQSGAVVRMEAVEAVGEHRKLSASRIRQILGDFGHSVSTDNQAVLALASAFPGEQRAVQADMAFLSVYGWTAAVFDDDDLHGVYILGESRILDPHLVKIKNDDLQDDNDGEEKEKRSINKSFREGISNIGRFFRRDKNSSKEKSADKSQNKEEPQANHITEKNPDVLSDNSGQEVVSESKPVRSFFTRIGNSFRQNKKEIPKDGKKPAEDTEDDLQNQIPEEVEYVFAYLPEIKALYNDAGEPQIPQNLLPLCHLFYSNEIRPETVETFSKFTESGVNLKVFLPGAPGRVIIALQKAGTGFERDGITQLIPGSELAALDEDTFRNAAREKSIFSHTNIEQSKQIVESLQDDGRTVTVVGGGPSDLPVMQQANLSIAAHGSSQAAMSVADIILLEESPSVLMKALKQGQKIVNGLLDVLKLYLTQLIYLVFLILVLVVSGYGFPYISKQGTFIAIATLTLPSLGFSLWALPGAPPKVDQLGRTLTRFVGPAAVTIGAAGAALFIYFANTTGERAYAQLALTYMLVFSGLTLVILIRPPTRYIPNDETNETGTENSNALKRDLKPTIYVLAISLVFILFAPMRWTQWLFELDNLRQGTDYLIVGMAVIAWVVVVNIIWWIFRPKSNQKPPEVADE